jgi:hypothetical protein
MTLSRLINLVRRRPLASRVSASPALHLSLHRSLRTIMLGGLAGLLVACGGGGGGGDNSVGVTIDSPTRIDSQTAEGSTLPDVTLNAHFTGNFASLNGQTLLLVIEDPDGLFEQQPQVTLSVNGNLSLVLTGKLQASARTVSGTVRILACLDVNCTRQLAGSPYSLPYQVTVRPGLTLGSQTLDVATTFGQTPAVQQVSVGLPEFLSGWQVQAFDPVTGFSSNVVLESHDAAAAAGQTTQLTLTLPPQPPGSHVATVRVRATITPPGRAPLEYVKDLQVTHQVSDNPAVAGVYFPTSLDLTRTQGDILSAPARFQFVSRSTDVTNGPTVRYLTAPAAAQGHQQLQSWLILFPESVTSTCFNTVFSSDCLPAGDYTAAVDYVVGSGPAATTVSLPVTLHIVPAP